MNNPTQTPLSEQSREQIYQQIRTSSKDAVILEEMQRLGFWPQNTGAPSLEEELIQRESTLIQELNTLVKTKTLVDNPADALRLMHLQRMAKAREKRLVTKQKRLELKQQKAENWAQKKNTDIIYLGEGVSKGLSETSSFSEKLSALQLPYFQSVNELAEAMGITLAELRFLTFQRKVSTVSHYQRFEMVKKSGGIRIISAPMPRLKRAQYWVLDTILNKIPVHSAAHGFITGRSIQTNADIHTESKVVINLDLKDFFPSIKFPRIKGIFKSWGYSEQIATILGLLCTETPSEKIQVDQQTFFVASGARHLPQGAPTSPMLTNILCFNLDKKLAAIASRLGFKYSRYADDLTFSLTTKNPEIIGKLLFRVKQTIAAEGFTLHPEKQQIMWASQQQKVTGLVVNNAQLSIDKKTLKRFRATLFQVEKNGAEGRHWNGNHNVVLALHGYAHFVYMVNPKRGAEYIARTSALLASIFGKDYKLYSKENTARQFVVEKTSPEMVLEKAVSDAVISPSSEKVISESVVAPITVENNPPQPEKIVEENVVSPLSETAIEANKESPTTDLNISKSPETKSKHPNKIDILLLIILFVIILILFKLF